MTGAGAGASYGDLLVTSLLVLGAVCIAAFVAVRLFGRLLSTGRARGAHLLDVVARLPLEPRRSLYVVEVAGKTLLVGTSEMGLSVLSELDGGEVRARVAAKPTFAELVRNAWQKRTQARKTAARASTGDEPLATQSRSDERSATRVRSDEPSATHARSDKPAPPVRSEEPVAKDPPGDES